MTEITIYHNPGCGTSRNVLAQIRNSGVEPKVIEYLKTPPDRATLEALLAMMKIRPRELLLYRPSETVLDILRGPRK
jgi:arsenate reductase